MKMIKLRLSFGIDPGRATAALITIDFAEPARNAAARLRRDVASFGLKCLPIFIRPRTCGGVGKSVTKPPYVAFLGEHQWSWRLVIMTNARIDDHRPTLALPTGHPDDIARLQDRQRLQRLGAAVRASLRLASLQIGKLCPQARVRPKAPACRPPRPSRPIASSPCAGAPPRPPSGPTELGKGLLEEGTSTSRPTLATRFTAML